jgi:hypothetical protein
VQGLGFSLGILGYALVYAAYSQGFGLGGSVLYWLTGSAKLGAPTTPTSSSSTSTSTKNGSTPRGTPTNPFQPGTGGGH